MKRFLAYSEYLVTNYEGFFPSGKSTCRAKGWIAMVEGELSRIEFERFLVRVGELLLLRRTTERAESMHMFLVQLAPAYERAMAQFLESLQKRKEELFALTELEEREEAKQRDKQAALER